jgi:hypothetical protein
VGDRPTQPAAAKAARIRVTLVTRSGCHLCADAREVVAAVCAELEVGWEERDLATGWKTDPVTVARWTDAVPVTLVDGVEHDFWRVSPERLRNALARAPHPGSPAT